MATTARMAKTTVVRSASWREGMRVRSRIESTLPSAELGWIRGEEEDDLEKLRPCWPALTMDAISIEDKVCLDEGGGRYPLQ